MYSLDPLEKLDQASAMFYLQLGLTHQDINVFLKHGFDTFESILYLDQETLIAMNLGSKKTRELILRNVQNLKEMATTSTEPAELVTCYQRQLGGVRMTEPFLGLCATNKKEASSVVLGKITHLTMNDKKLSKMENLHKCPKLQILYLYDNKITRIEALQHCQHLTVLYLQNNLINKISGLEGLHCLKKLFLEHNCISRLEGLQDQVALQELYLSNQSLARQQRFSFDQTSLAVIGRSLNIITLENCNIENPQPLFFLESVRTVKLSGNLISDPELLCPMLATLQIMRDLDLRKNPMCKISKIRDFIISRNSSLNQIDGKEVSQRERTFITRLAQKKEKPGSMKENKHENVKEAPKPNVMPAMGTFEKVENPKKPGLHPSYKRVVKKKEVLSSNGLSIMGNTKPIYVPIPQYGPPSAPSSDQTYKRIPTIAGARVGEDASMSSYLDESKDKIVSPKAQF